ncbi:MAG: carboxypeptidase-like regulatory domain-containing protein [Cyclobacteriaceae bacterium]|jgi:hypothetical protein
MRCLLLYFFLLPILASAQGFEVKGRVLDAETGKPLPFANLQIENTRLGTTTNVEGYFSLFVPGEAPGSKLLISYIGYRLFKAPLRQVPAVVRLVPESRELKELVVMPDSSLFVFLREAYRSIEKNYSTDRYQLKGFYRESLKLTEGDYYYFGEAELIAQGSGYQFKQEKGSVKILKSRINHFAPADSLRQTLYYGGPFIAVSNDLVKNQLEVLRPDRKGYDYQLADVAKNMGLEVWVVSFQKKDGTLRGRLFIEKDSKAYVRTEITRLYKDSASRSSWSRVHDIKGTVRNSYVKHGQHFFLAYTSIQKNQFNTQLNKPTTITAEFSTNEIFPDSLSHISFQDELEYTGIFSQIQDNFAQDFWRGSSAIVPDSSLQAQLKPLTDSVEVLPLKNVQSRETDKKKPDEFKRLQRVVGLLTRISTGVGLQLLPLTVQGADLQLQYATPNQTLMFAAPLSETEFPVLLTGETAFKINKRFQAFVNITSDLSRQYEFKGASVGARYSFKLNKRGNPFLLRPSFAYGSMLMGMGTDVFDNPGDLSFDGKGVKDDRLRFYVGEQTRYLRPSFSFEKKLQRLRWIYVDVGYLFTLRQRNMLFLEDRSGFFLFRQFRGVTLENTDAVVSQNGERIQSQNLNWFNSLFVEAGLRWRF